MSEIEIEELARRLGEVAIVDVRTPHEYDGSLGKPVVCYCHSGSRSAFAVQVLVRFGYDARNYPGSWHEWSRTALPIEG